MSGFSKDWLALREPLDLAARNSAVENVFCAELEKTGGRILDLGSGAGSTIAALSQVLKRPVDWVLSDNDKALLDAAAQRIYDPSPASVSLLETDLSRDLEQLPFKEADGVTTSAFLDLVSVSFLDRLATCIVSADLPFLASLSYDGRMVLTPGDRLDKDISSAINRDQITDKGFGPALGPAAAEYMIELLRSHGYAVTEGRSDWKAGAEEGEFLIEYLSGCAGVARRAGVNGADMERWWDRRRSQIADRALSVSVGHVDFAAIPPKRD